MWDNGIWDNILRAIRHQQNNFSDYSSHISDLTSQVKLAVGPDLSANAIRLATMLKFDLCDGCQILLNRIRIGRWCLGGGLNGQD
jgi:hypothetical protein